MATSNVSTGSYIGIPNCYCNELAVLKTSWTEANPGRRFLGCRNYEISRSCGYFFWYDAPVQDHAKVVINGLLRRLNNLEREKEVQESKERRLIVVIVILVAFILYLLN
ncbi:GRF zinc finger protein [Rhynchospora pubera]|uniref:GRF zinc finger protein n=1 Tax=Rhynchospora pubera TaxID=906938 RepID=A0AAV8H196_9POAL|nr:GRF zinc finger protein [Rhynchospora pubera]